MANNEVFDELLIMANLVAEKVQILKQNGELVKESISYRKTTIDDYHFENGSVKQMLHSTSIIERFEWDSYKVSKIIKQLLLDSSYYRTCSNIIADAYSLPASIVRSWLHQKIHILFVAVAETPQDTEETAIAWVHKILTSLDEDLVWDIEIRLDGLWSTDKAIQLSENIQLRQPRPSDFESLIPANSTHSTRHDIFKDSFSAIIELKLIGFQYAQPQRAIRTITAMLRLFRLCSVVSFQETFRSSKPSPGHFGFGGAFSSLHERVHKPIYTRGMNLDDARLFQVFDDKIHSLLDEIENRETPLSIAYNRYEVALFDRSLESRITFAVMCLEALYLAEMSELKHRLSQRVAILLGTILKTSTQSIYDDVGNAYKKRSTFVHGGVFKSGKHAEIRQLCEKIMNYCRLSILIFLQLQVAQNRKAKQEFLHDLDLALIDNDVHKSLNEKINLLWTR